MAYPFEPIMLSSLQPALAGDGLDHGAAAQDGLADVGDEEGVERVVVEGVGAGDALERELGGRAQDGGVVGLGPAEELAVVAGEAPGEGVDGRREGLEHGGLLPAPVEDARDSTGAGARHAPAPGPSPGGSRAALGRGLPRDEAPLRRLRWNA